MRHTQRRQRRPRSVNFWGLARDQRGRLPPSGVARGCVGPVDGETICLHPKRMRLLHVGYVCWRGRR